MKTIRISSPQVPSVYLQTITEQDASYEYVEWLNDPLINQYLETRFYVQDLTAIKNFIHLMISDPNEHLFTIRLKESHKHIGNIKIGGIKPHHHVGEVSLFIGDKKSWGKGIATQAIQLISRYSFEYLQLRKLSAGAYKPNIGSTKAFLKAGFSNDCVLKDHYMLNEQPCDLVEVCLFKRQQYILPKLIVEMPSA